VRPRDRLRAWVKLLALSAARPGRRFSAVVVGRARQGAPEHAEVSTARIASPGEVAVSHLVGLIELYDRGMREPLPLACETSAAYAAAVAAGLDAEGVAARAWKSAFRYDKEDRLPEHRLAFGGQVEFAELMRPGPRDDERWIAGEASRFGQYARRLWDPLLAHEELGDR
jgi:exodeoxyribonuclease V gamma subunit